MSKNEKIQLIIGFTLFLTILLFPSIFLIINKYYVWAIPPIIGLLVFCYIVKKFHCSKCFNFSCPLNNQPKWVIDEFLKRNPTIRKAWEKRGWQIGEQTSCLYKNIFKVANQFCWLICGFLTYSKY